MTDSSASGTDDGPEGQGSDAARFPAYDPPSSETDGDRPGIADEPPQNVQPPSWGRRAFLAVRELLIVVVIALVASALLRAFVVQAFYVPSGSMLPEIQLQDKIVVSRIGDVDRGEVVVFENPGDWLPPSEQTPDPGPVRAAIEFIGLLPQTGNDHLVKRVVGLPGDHVVCCNNRGRLVINGEPVDESSYLFQGGKRADNESFDVVVPKNHIFVLGDHRYDSRDSSWHLPSQDAFVPMGLVTGRAFAVVWPLDHAHIMHIPSGYDDVSAGRTPPDKGIVKRVRKGPR
ncbi:MAG: signal peptidase I [Nocardioidaceae bacterium]